MIGRVSTRPGPAPWVTVFRRVYSSPGATARLGREGTEHRRRLIHRLVVGYPSKAQNCAGIHIYMRGKTVDAATDEKAAKSHQTTASRSDFRVTQAAVYTSARCPVTQRRGARYANLKSCYLAFVSCHTATRHPTINSGAAICQKTWGGPGKC
jgi:hypothetical protein